MCIAEYSAAMRGITTIETTKAEALDEAKPGNRLNKNDVDDLKRLLAEKG